MIGSETFIMVAFRWSEKSTPSALAAGDLLLEKATSAFLLMKVASRISPALRASLSLSTLCCAVGADELDLHVGGRSGR
jgi:hypothetical protein